MAREVCLDTKMHLSFYQKSSDFQNVMKPQVVQRSMVDLPSSREKRFEEPYRREKSDVSVRSSVPDARPRSREVPRVRARGRVDLNNLVDGSIGDILRNRRFFITKEIIN